MKNLAASLLALGLTVAATHAPAEPNPDKLVHFNLPAQPLNQALNNFAHQAELRIVFDTADAEGLDAPALNATLTADQALRKLLDPTGLRAEYLDSKTIAIRKNVRTISGAWDERGNEGDGDRGLMHLAQNMGEGAQNPDFSAGNAEGAQSSDEGSKGDLQLEEVIVTAQRRAENLQDVPISIAVLGGDQLDASNAVNLTEELNRVPGISTTTNALSGGNTTLQVRGVGAANALYSGASPVGFYLDSVPFGFVRSALVPDLGAYDLDHVEVLKGPQGTLYGVNSLNGTVRVLTEDANLDEFEFQGRASASGTEGGDPNYRGDVALNAPLVSGVLGARVVLSDDHVGGWVGRLNETNTNDSEQRTLRFKVNAQPTDAFSAEFMAWISRREDDGLNAPDTAAGVRNTNSPEVGQSDLDVYSFQLAYDFGEFSLESATSHIDFLNEGVFGLFPGAPSDLYINVASEVFSQEFTAQSNYEGSWNWVLGAIYRDVQDNTDQEAFFRPGGLHIADESTSYATFGEVTKEFFDDHLRITGGVRYFHDEVTQSQTNVNNTGVNTSVTRNFNATTPRLVVTWLPEENFTAYASYSQGFRSGLNQSGSLQLIAPQFGPAGPDTLTNYEIGFKGNTPDHRFTYEAAVYYIDWTDIQLNLTIPNPFGPIGSFLAFVNGEGASGYGVDGAVSLEPVSGFQVGASFSYNDVTLNSDVISDGSAIFRQGQRLGGSPEYTIGANASLDIPLSDNMLLTLAGSANYQAGYRTGGSTASALEWPSTVLFRGSANLNFYDQWGFSLFAENIGNEQSVIFPGQAYPTIRPRVVGLQLQYHY